MLTRLLGALVLSGALVLIAAGCERAEKGGMDEAEIAMDETEAAAMMDQVQLPDTTAAALWAYLQKVEYRNNWELWPEKGELYQGQEPHGMLLTTYVNPAAYDALMNKAGSLPDKAIIVKENYMPDSTLAAITTMYKVAGYDPEHNDWFWAKHDPNGGIQVEGRGPGCIACHGGKSANDYIWTAALE